jgi:hypothetical protein
MSLSRYALLNPTTNEYYLNPIGTPRLFNTEEEAENILYWERKYQTLSDVDLYVPVEVSYAELEKLNKATLKKGLFNE